MRLALQIPHFHSVEPASIGPWLADIAVAADESELESLWLMDHFFQLGSFDWLGPVEGPMLEGYTTLGYLAALTKRLRLGLLVTGAPYRHPGVLVKTVTTLDVLSGGRANLGLGAAWNADEARGLGIPFPPLAERYERLEETLQIALRMWAGDTSPYQGQHYTLDRPLHSPSALTRPHPPILVGGSGRNRTLQLVARYADACNVSGTYYNSPEDVGELFDVLRGHCAVVGRPYEAISRTVLDTFDLSTPAGIDAAIGSCTALAAVGVQTVMVNLSHAFNAKTIDLFARELVPAAAAMPAGSD